jgi:cytochrome P450
MRPAERVVTLAEAAMTDAAGAYRDLLRSGRVVWDEDSASWYVLSADLVRSLLRDDRLGARGVPAAVADLPAEERRVIGPVEEFLGRWLVFSDPPKQAALRRALAPELTRVKHVALVERLPIEAAALAKALDSRAGDLLDDVVRPLSRLTMRELLGLDESQLVRVEELSEPLMRYLGTPGMDCDRAAAASVAITSLVELTEQFTAAGIGGTATALRRLRDADARVDELDVAAAYAQLITGALEPLTTAVTECVVAAAHRSDQALADPAGFVEATLRANPPFHFGPRVARTEIRIDGHLIRPGQRVVLNLLAAGQTDCPVTGGAEHPESFAFGAGTHFCLGASVSRAHLVAVVPVLVRMGLPERVDPDRVVRRPAFGMSSFERVPITAASRSRRPGADVERG